MEGKWKGEIGVSQVKAETWATELRSMKQTSYINEQTGKCAGTWWSVNVDDLAISLGVSFVTDTGIAPVKTGSICISAGENLLIQSAPSLKDIWAMSSSNAYIFQLVCLIFHIFLPVDSQFAVLHFVFWHRDRQVNSLSANSQKNSGSRSAIYGVSTLSAILRPNGRPHWVGPKKYFVDHQKSYRLVCN